MSKAAHIAYWCVIVALLTLALADTRESEPAGQPSNQRRTEETYPKGSKRQQPEPFWQRTVDDPNAFFSLWVAAFTGVLAFSTIGLWTATLRHASHMEDAVSAAKISADAAVRTADAAIEAQAAQMYVSRYIANLDDFSTIKKISPNIDPDKRMLTSIVTIKNAGRSLAFLDFFTAEIYLGKLPLPREPIYPFGTRNNLSRRNGMIIEPGETFAIRAAIPRPISFKDEWLGGFMFVYGFIEYTDVFRRVHEIGFCALHNGFTGFGEDSIFMSQDYPAYVYHRLRDVHSSGDGQQQQ